LGDKKKVVVETVATLAKFGDDGEEEVRPGCCCLMLIHYVLR